MARRRRSARKSKIGLPQPGRLKLKRSTRKQISFAGFVAGALIFSAVVYHFYYTTALQTQHRTSKPARKFTPHVAAATVVPQWPAPRPAAAPQPGVQPVRPAPAKPRPGGKPALVFVIDDIGHTRAHENELAKLGSSVTYAILPNLKHSRYFADMSLRTGAEVILHQPLQAADDTIPGPGLITVNMPDSQIRETLNRNLASVPHRVGINNHMGSKGTSDARVMKVILEELDRRGLFFLDSYTTPNSVSIALAQRLGVPVLKRSIFLDNVDEREAIRKQVRQLAASGRQRGFAVGIGHDRPNTLKVLQEEIARLRREGFEITSLSALLSS